jgi:transposase
MQKIVGIDVSSLKLNIHFLDTNQDFEIANDKQSIEHFIIVQGLDKNNCIVGCESTGRYHLVCQSTFVNLGFTFKVLNPILTNSKIRLTVRQKKTDISDAKLIAQVLEQGEGTEIKEHTQNNSRRTILRTRSTLVQHKTSLKLLVQELKRDLNDNELKHCIDTVNNLISIMENSIDSLEDEVLCESQATETEKLIDSVPGFALKLSAIVASEVGDFSRFPSSRQFKAYVGVDPKVKQSGNSTYTGKITKRGNPHLRSAFYLAAQVARCHDPELKSFYEKKKSEGKATRVAIIAVARKLCERVYSVVKRGVEYEIRSNELSFV